MGVGFSLFLSWSLSRSYNDMFVATILFCNLCPNARILIVGWPALTDDGSIPPRVVVLYDESCQNHLKSAEKLPTMSTITYGLPGADSAA